MKNVKKSIFQGKNFKLDVLFHHMNSKISLIKAKCLAIPWHPVEEGHDRLETEQDGLTQEALQ